MDRDTLLAFDDKGTVWKQEYCHPIHFSSDGVQIIHAHHDDITCLDYTIGAVKWKQEIGRHLGPFGPQYTGVKDRIYTNTREGVTAIDTKDGKRVWTKDVKAYSLSASDEVVVASSPHGTFCLNALDGAKRFSMSTPLFDHVCDASGIYGIPDEGYHFTDQVSAFNLDGQRTWRNKLDCKIASLGLGTDHLLVVDMQGRLYANSKKDGKHKWEQKVEPCTRYDIKSHDKVVELHPVLCFCPMPFPFPPIAAPESYEPLRFEEKTGKQL
jgi:outer membrane protein assembly factor BamB